MTPDIDALTAQLLAFDKDAEIARITERMREMLRLHLRRRGLVAAM